MTDKKHTTMPAQAHLHTTVYLITIAALLLAGPLGLHAQQDGGNRRSVDITSSYKPSLLPPKKLSFTASPLQAAEQRPALTYNLPVQNLAFSFTPSPLRPLAFEDTTRRQEDKGYVQLGYGNFSTPFLQAAANFGNGRTSSGNVEAHYTGSKGKLPFQQFARYGFKVHNIAQLDDNHQIQLRGGVQGHTTHRYGFRPDSLPFTKDQLKLNYTDIHAGASVGNQQPNAYGLTYHAHLDAHLFSDNLKGNESAFAYSLPLEKAIHDDITATIALGGLVSRVKNDDTTFNNNLTTLRAGARFALGEHTHVNAALVPAWNNGDFALLPDVEVENYLANKDMVLQLGVKGSFIQNTWRSLVAFNPWVAQPTALTHSRNTEVYLALKAPVSEHLAFRIKGNYQARKDVPLLVNRADDGKTFDILWEPALNMVGGSAELLYQKGTFSWSNHLLVQSFTGLKQAEKAFGLLPVEFTSSARYGLKDKLHLKADAFAFLPAWHRLPDLKAQQGNGAIDLNLGAEFDIQPRIALWLQFNNLLNSRYERWNQFEVLGFQAVGGVIVRF